MLIIAGLSPTLAPRVRAALDSATGNTVEVLVPPANLRDQGWYTPRYVETLLVATGGFAVRRRSNQAQTAPTPSSIVLAYIPGTDDEELLSAFDFFAYPIPLIEIGWNAETGRHERHDYELVMQILLQRISRSSIDIDVFRNLQDRISKLFDDNPLLLPPLNFQTTAGVPLANTFAELRSGYRTWAEGLNVVHARRFDHSSFPRLEVDQRKDLLQDARGLIFKNAHPTAYHGSERQIEAEEGDGKLHIKLTKALQSLYRFGAALPNGFHHDASLARGKPLENFAFNCAEKGEIVISADYANIYPNDFVRPGHPKVMKQK